MARRRWHRTAPRLLGALLVAATLRASRLKAQAPALRSEVDSLLAAADSLQVLPAPLPISGSDPATRLRRGFGELIVADSASAAGRLGPALLDFYEVTVKRPDWAYAWLGLGLTKLRLDVFGVPEIRAPHQPAGTGWRAGALNAFEQALRRQPALGRALAGVTEVLRREAPGPTRDRAERLLREYTNGRALDAEGALALAEADDASDSLVAAEAAIGAYLGAGGDTGVADWELARIRFAAGDANGGSERYYAAIARGAEVIRRRLRDDLAFVATPTELAAFDSCPPAERVEWVRRFWASREVAAGRPPGSRLQEHFRRVRYAHKHFYATSTKSLVSFHRAYYGAPPGLDDRAVIYIRQGEPDMRATYVGGDGISPNESWAYFRPEGELVFHFYADIGNAFRLADVLSAVVCPLRPTCDPSSEVYESRANLGLYYLDMANRLELEQNRMRVVGDPVKAHPVITPELAFAERRRTLADVRTGTTTDADPLDLERTWEPIAQVFGTIDPGTGSTGLLVVAALPAPRDLAPLTLPGGAAGYILHLRATAALDSLGVTLDSDVVRHLRTPHPLRPDESLTLVEHFPLGAGHQRVRLILADSTESRGAVRLFPDVPVVAPGSDSLSVSDLITGRVGSAVTWRRPDGHLIELQPNNAWHPSDVLSIAFDVGGLTAGAPYRVRIGIADLGADTLAPAKASVEFENQATAPHAFVQQALDLRALKPGTYLLSTTVTAEGRSVRRDRRITVVGR